MRISATVQNVVAALSKTPGAASLRSGSKTATRSPPLEEIAPSWSTSTTENARKASSKSDESTPETRDKSVVSQAKAVSQPSDVAKATIEADKSAPEVGGQRLSERLKQRDLDFRLYELTNAVKGVRHVGHVRFEASADAPGASLAVDRESTLEQNETSLAPSIVETIQRKNNERALKARERAKLSDELELHDLEAKREEQERFKAPANPKDDLQPEYINETQTARERLESLLLAAKPLPNYANTLGYVDADRPYGDSGLLDVFA